MPPDPNRSDAETRSLKPDTPLARSKDSVEALATTGEPIPDERTLIERARARDQAAFRALVERYRDRAHGLALRIVRSPADAEEVAQDAFVRAWLALPQFRGESSFSTWLHRIVARRAFDRLQVLRRRRDREAPLAVAEREPDPVSSVTAGAVVLAHRLERLVAGLPDDQRAVVTLFYNEDRSVDQVAAILGMPTGTVKTHLSRARAALRAAWLEHEKATTR